MRRLETWLAGTEQTSNGVPLAFAALTHSLLLPVHVRSQIAIRVDDSKYLYTESRTTANTYARLGMTRGCEPVSLEGRRKPPYTRKMAGR